MANGGKNKIVAALLAFFLGALGIHHFYLGSTMAGVVILVASIFTCGAAGIISFVEFIMLLIMKDEEFDARYNARTPEPMEFVFMKPKS
jgi:TM2 domain-containing membrane protein YozV